MYLGYFNTDTGEGYLTKDVEGYPQVGLPFRNKTYPFMPEHCIIEYVESLVFEEVGMEIDAKQIGLKEKAFLGLFFRGVSDQELEDLKIKEFVPILWEWAYEEITDTLEGQYDDENW